MSVKVTVVDLVGRSLQLELPGAETVKVVRDAVAASWGLDLGTFHLLVQTERMDETRTLESFLMEAAETIEVQLLKFDPLLDLGQFVGRHRGVKKSGEHRDTIKKTMTFPDSNNVFIRHGIREPCFVEFEVVCCRDEMSFGVTYDRKKMERVSDHGNLSVNTTWIFSRKRAMPVFYFGGESLSPPDVPGVQEGDTIGVYADPELRLVEFYCNGLLVGSSDSLKVPLPQADERPLWMYAMVDEVNDEIRIKRFGPGRP